MPRKKQAKKASASARKPSVATLRAKMVQAIEKKFGAGSAVIIGEERRKSASQIKEYIPSGVDVLDNYVIGRGGAPVGRLSEIFGPEGCGKTSLLYTWLASVQRLGGVAALADPENSFDEERAATLGVDLDELILLESPPSKGVQTIEMLIEQMKLLISSHDPRVGPLLVGWDSIASAISSASTKKSAGERKVGDIPGILSEELKKLNSLLPKFRAHLMMMNQIRDKLGVMFGDKTTTPGGHAPKFYSSMRLQFFGGKAIKNKLNEHTGKVVTIMAVKNRLSPPFRKARVRFDFAYGYNNLWTTLEHAKRLKVIDPRECGYSGRGKETLAHYYEALEALDWEPTGVIPDLGEAPEEAEEDHGEDTEEEEGDE